MSWVCSSCTLINSNASGLACEVCGTTRNDPAEAGASLKSAGGDGIHNPYVGGSTSTSMSSSAGMPRSRILDVIRRYNDNVRLHPGEAKFRKLKLSNDTLAAVW